tara:strand:+ start:1760 stop:2122 length:363 start_codon:yes stop_codon:yes gene_type:complete
MIRLFLLLNFFLPLIPTEEQESRALSIAENFRCPTCKFVSISDSNTPISNEIYELILEMVIEGKTEEEIRIHLIERYGDWIVFEPPRRGIHQVIWYLPYFFCLGGFFYLKHFLIGKKKDE